MEGPQSLFTPILLNRDQTRAVDAIHLTRQFLQHFRTRVELQKTHLPVISIRDDFGGLRFLAMGSREETEGVIGYGGVSLGLKGPVSMGRRGRPSLRFRLGQSIRVPGQTVELLNRHRTG